MTVATNQPLLKAMTEPPRALYVHIPFCASRCFYCDFTTFVAPAALRDAYVDQLCREFELLAPLTTQPLDSVFFGGGTPTLLSPEQLERVLCALRDTFAVAPDAEFTFEANPGTVTAEKLLSMRRYGVNRLSFGAQSLNDRLLMAIGRLHDADTVLDSVKLAQSSGFNRINVDLMFGLPDQSLDDVNESVDGLLALGIEHVSAYWLKVEAGTPFAAWQAQGALPLPGEDAEADMYEAVRTRLRRAGYRHYEVSNFARPGGESRHNLVYWHNLPYLAAGVGAHGYLAGLRYENVSALPAYAKALQSGTRPIEAQTPVSPAAYAEDTMMLGLRLAEGVSRQVFKARHGVDMDEVFRDPIMGLQEKGLLMWNGDALCLTDKAWPLANLVFSEFIGVLEDD
jgi:oxygen-independent coproporphyrinogen III oxidase